jgi:stage V sporulation protein R
VSAPARSGASWRDHVDAIERLAAGVGLEYDPVDFEAVPESFMMEISVYGLPVRMPHWSFGLRYISQLIQHRMGHSRLFEVVFPGNPGHAYLAAGNSLAENVLVTAHVLGHADFSRNNLLFRRSQQQVGANIVESAARHAQQIAQAIEEHGQARVERVLDAALALEQHVDVQQPLARPRFAEYAPPPARHPRPTRSASATRRWARTPGASCTTRCACAPRCRRGPSATCCGSSRSTRRTWRAGSATSSSRCARSRSTSIRCSRPRS